MSSHLVAAYFEARSVSTIFVISTTTKKQSGKERDLGERPQFIIFNLKSMINKWILLTEIQPLNVND